jgi:hypothetical protein
MSNKQPRIVDITVQLAGRRKDSELVQYSLILYFFAVRHIAIRPVGDWAPQTNLQVDW